MNPPAIGPRNRTRRDISVGRVLGRISVCDGYLRRCQFLASASWNLVTDCPKLNSIRTAFTQSSIEFLGCAPTTMTRHLLRELAHKAIVHKGYDEAFAFFLAKLGELNITVDNKDMNRGEIVATCLTTSANMVLWRCWSDRLVFRMQVLNPATTEVTIYSIPNLFRWNIKPHEKTADLKKLVSELFG